MGYGCYTFVDRGIPFDPNPQGDLSLSLCVFVCAPKKNFLQGTGEQTVKVSFLAGKKTGLKNTPTMVESRPSPRGRTFLIYVASRL